MMMTATTATATAMNKSTRISKYCTEKIMNCSCSSSWSRRSTNVLFFPGKTSAMEQKQSRSSRRRRPTIVLKKAMMIDDDDDEKRDRNTAKADEDEFQVFRFTLGITGFDDSEIPKALGVISAALLIANKVASNGQLGVSSSAAAQRGDMIGFFLVLASVATPYIGRRIEEATTGNSRARSSREQSIDISGGSSQFLCNERFKERKQTNYAWASYALLTNTNAKGLAFFEDDGKTMSLARGSVRTIVIDDGKNSNDEEILMKLAKGFSYDEITNNKERKKKEKKKNNDDDDDDDTKNIVYYLSNRMELDGVGANLWEFLPPGAESAVIRRAETGSKGILVAYSDEPRAFNKKARLWIGQLAEKMSTDD